MNARCVLWLVINKNFQEGNFGDVIIKIPEYSRMKLIIADLKNEKIEFVGPKIICKCVRQWRVCYVF
jgi:hypothetical protein